MIAPEIPGYSSSCSLCVPVQNVWLCATSPALKGLIDWISLDSLLPSPRDRVLGDDTYYFCHYRSCASKRLLGSVELNSCGTHEGESDSRCRIPCSYRKFIYVATSLLVLYPSVLRPLSSRVPPLIAFTQPFSLRR